MAPSADLFEIKKTLMKVNFFVWHCATIEIKSSINVLDLFEGLISGSI